ncbi:MAG: leucine--tRNA ligase [candidate division FCPU426 bacterium]
MSVYDPGAIESKWQRFWLENKTFRALDPGDPGFDASRPKSYLLDMFPYPSGDGLHVGHPVGYTATDILARYKRMKGFNVLHPMGWDSFGLPAEQYAVKTGQHPAVTTKKNIETFRAQIRRLGFSYDWDREIATSDPEYYRWTQWIFRKLFEKGLAYQAEAAVWWCEGLGTVLANEEVDSEGNSEVGGFPCVRRNMRQWMLRITSYAQRLLDDLKGLDWPHGIIKMQEDWIGRSEGADLDFEVSGGTCQGERLRVFTTRPDTLYGATYLVLAPEHPLVRRLASPDQQAAVSGYLEQASRRSERERMADTKEKTGVFTGSYAKNPVNGADIPIWVADYVLAGYGTGAIMAVPAHDLRDHDFAKAMGLKIVAVVRPLDGSTPEGCMDAEGIAVNSGPLDGLDSASAKEAMIQTLEARAIGKRVVRFRLRDWLFSRQRYWGEPFPVVFDKQGRALLVGEDDLPISLPEMESFRATGGFEAPLARAKDWMTTPEGVRETNVMPQWAGSCWYFLRFTDPHNANAPWNRDKADYWMPVDLYIGGAEHAVLHLLYSRFWYKVFFDLGLVSQTEPFRKLFNQGMIGGTSYKTVSGSVVKTDDVRWISGKPTHPESGEELLVTQAKMSKSLGNVINPDTLVAQYGADSLRLYEMFMGPLEQGKVWDTNGINGTYRFLKRAHHLIVGDGEGACRPELLDAARASERDLDGALHRCLKQVGEDIEGLRFNTGISALMVLVNAFGERVPSRSQAKVFVLMLAPFAPHLAEELWERLGHSHSLAFESWPHADVTLAAPAEVQLVVQVNGRLRSKLSAPAGMDAAQTEKMALSDEKIRAFLAGKSPKKVIVVAGKLVNLVVEETREN